MSFSVIFLKTKVIFIQLTGKWLHSTNLHRSISTVFNERHNKNTQIRISINVLHNVIQIAFIQTMRCL